LQSPLEIRILDNWLEEVNDFCAPALYRDIHNDMYAVPQPTFSTVTAPNWRRSLTAAFAKQAVLPEDVGHRVSPS
jgi:hypothetical protein